MNKDSKKFLYKLLETPSPTGFEEKIQKVVSSRMEKYADTLETDLHGNLFVSLNPKAEKKIMLAGHCDQIGFMVKHITKDGFIYLAPLGGIDPTVLPGSRVTIQGKKGPVDGVIGRRPIHLQNPEDRGRFRVDFDKVWVDIGAKDQKAAEALIEIGDPATYELGVKELGKDFISGPGLDDRVGLFVVMEALRLCARNKLSVGLVAVSTVQEEVGLRGATTASYYVKPEVGIAVDVTHATDNPGNAEKKQAPCVLGKGPAISKGPNTNPVVAKKFIEAAKKSKIPHQLAPNANLQGNDARVMQVSGRGVATIALGIPNRYMHTQIEVCSLKDLENTAKLIAEFVKSTTSRTNFIPR